jgi:hypothetical protein
MSKFLFILAHSLFPLFVCGQKKIEFRFKLETAVPAVTKIHVNPGFKIGGSTAIKFSETGKLIGEFEYGRYSLMNNNIIHGFTILNGQIHVVALSVGVQKSIGNFHVRPSVGFGDYGGKIDFGDFADGSDFAWEYSIEAGYDLRRISFFTDFQRVESRNNFWYGPGLSIFGFGVSFKIAPP